jgi:putative ABC transport system permease protein
MGSGVCSGLINAFLQTKMKVESMLAGIIVNTGLYTINIAIMGKSNVNMNDTKTVFTMMKEALADTPLASFSKLIVALLFVLVVLVLLILFLGTRLGLSIRATGDNIAMVKTSSINPAFTIAVGLCIGGALTALSGCLLGEYQKSVDINMGSGMVTIALASLIIGETLFSRGGILIRAFGVVFGSCLYRVIVAVALRFNLPASALKLVSALIVAIAISMPAIKEYLSRWKTKQNAMRKRKREVAQRGGSGKC